MAIAHVKDWIPEAKDRISDMSEKLPDGNTTEAGLGAALFAAAIVSAAINVVRHRRGATAWVLPATLASSGMALFATGTIQRRSQKISTAEEVVREELGSLDPFARAKVLKDIAQEQVEKYVPESED